MRLAYPGVVSAASTFISTGLLTLSLIELLFRESLATHLVDSWIGNIDLFEIPIDTKVGFAVVGLSILQIPFFVTLIWAHVRDKFRWKTHFGKYSHLHLINSVCFCWILPIVVSGLISMWHTQTMTAVAVAVSVSTVLTIFGIVGVTTSFGQLFLIQRCLTVQPTFWFGLWLLLTNFGTARLFLISPMGEYLRL